MARGNLKERRKQGLGFEPYFTKGLEGSVYDLFEWKVKDEEIAGEDGRILFVQKNVEFPAHWDDLARKIVASKYFYGENGTAEREHSARQLVERVCSTFAEWGLKQKYFGSKKEAEQFKNELAYLVLDQRMAFNSPVWFNVGVHRIAGEGDGQKRDHYIINEKGKAVKIPRGKDRYYPQTSACFIQDVKDTMESIMDLAKKEAMLFKYGSGTGTNLSTLRSSREKLSGGGKPSGPLAYWKFYDKVAEIVKSGGKTRRAAKMDILNIDHPDILEFIESKVREEEKMKILISNGISKEEAQASVNYQNTNIAVRVTDEFMNAVEKDEEWKTVPIHNHELADQMPKYKARFLLRKIAESLHACGDPGVQYDTTINKWHTCPNSGRINASNPCSEYMFLDNSSCNLASLNLMKFLREDGTFDIEGYKSAIKTTVIAQDLEIDNSSYPTKEIAENSHKFRPLGTGYANLGALVMSLGLPYDSEEARAVAASVTALLTGTVYETSAEMAKKLGPFKEFEKNREPMLGVIKKHKEALKNIDRTKIPKNLEGILEEAERTWERVLTKGSRYGFRNAQATVLAPTGTIGRMMGCDTLGIEPEFALSHVKFLSDGGVIGIVNKNVDPVLKKLGYSVEERKEILNYVKEKKTMEGAPHIKEEHLPIFDCANKPEWAKRAISPQGHLKMMAAVQPFISGAISKTVNLPKETSVEDIEKVIIDSWKMGLKSVTLYRDGSKAMQVLTLSNGKNLEGKVRNERVKLPITAEALRHKFNISGHEGYLHIGLFEDGLPGELFITMSKEGSTVRGLMDTIGILTSLALQYGVPLKSLAEKIRNNKFEPSGIVFEGHPEIKTATSIPDYIFAFLQKVAEEGGNGKRKKKGEGNPGSGRKDKGPSKANESAIENSMTEELGGFCPRCGTQMIKKGNCNEICPTCGFVDQKGCGQ